VGFFCDSSQHVSLDIEYEIMKKNFYIFCFTVLGILLQFLIHGLLERWYIILLLKDFAKYSYGFSWAQLFSVHHALTFILLLIGSLFGFWQGRIWWKIVYENNKIK